MGDKEISLPTRRHRCERSDQRRALQKPAARVRRKKPPPPPPPPPRERQPTNIERQGTKSWFLFLDFIL